jgi:diguanylate cyclase (GGDEF)-like protein
MQELIQQPVASSAALRAVFELVSQGVFVVDRPTDRIVDVNMAACDQLCRRRESLIGRSWTSTIGRLGEMTFYSIDPQGRQFVAIAGTPSSAAPNRSPVQRDALTGLANRDALKARLSRAHREGGAEQLSLLFIDLDGFKQINDTWGHAGGDRVLRIVAQRLSDCVRPGDLVVRYGGDEFLVVVEGVTRRRDLERLLRRVARAVERPIVVEGHPATLTASIGIAQRKRGKESIDALIAEADRAMYRAKAKGRTETRRLVNASPRSLAVSQVFLNGRRDDGEANSP